MKKVLSFILLGTALTAFVSCGASKANCDAYRSEVIIIDQELDLAKN